MVISVFTDNMYRNKGDIENELSILLVLNILPDPEKFTYFTQFHMISPSSKYKPVKLASYIFLFQMFIFPYVFLFKNNPLAVLYLLVLMSLSSTRL